ncbi:MAG: peptidase M64 [Muribaculaceae bacterium]|nr:peptidase M64 [Muribaculaceae bacterium]
MKKLIAIACLALTISTARAIEFDQYFTDATLRLDYAFAGDAGKQGIYLDQLSRLPKWWGRRARLDEVPVAGDGTITMRDHKSGKVIYMHSFSSLFQEWISTAEAKVVRKSMENVFLVPMPRDTVDITVELRDPHHRVTAMLTHRVAPDDILIARLGERDVTPYVTLQQADDTTRCIHIAYVAEGYTEHEMPQFIEHCHEAMEALFSHEPFRSLRGRFHIVAVTSPSRDSGVSDPGAGLWLNTALGSHFDTFYSKRYLTTLHLKQLHNVLAGVPYEHIIILANTEHYGGGGIYNSYNLSYTRGKHFRPVVVHEFGHSFAGLADEYPYGNDDARYFSDVEPWEANITTMHDFTRKWDDMIDPSTPRPTPENTDSTLMTSRVGLFEGGGCMEKGVYRPVQECRMRTNVVPEFCPVCRRAIVRVIDFYTAPIH